MQIADHGNAQLARGIAQILQHAARGLGVQAGHGLVGQNHLRLLRQCTGNAHALHLPAGQGFGALIGLVGQPHTLQALVGQCNVTLPEQLHDRGQRTHLAQAPRQHVLAHRQALHQVVVLKNHGHMAGQIAARMLLHQVDTAHLQRAAVGLIQPIHAAQQGGLSRTGQAQHHHKLTGFHIHVDAMQHMVAAIAFAQIADGDHFIFPRSRFNALAV